MGNKIEKVKPPCRYYRDCGGCQLQHLSNATQNNYKQEKTEELLGKFGEVNRIITMDNPYHYRNKIHSTFGYDRKNNLIAGMYGKGSHRLINIEECIIQDPIGDKIVHTIKNIMKKYKMIPYNEDTGEGFLRHVLIRKGNKTGAVMVVLVVADNVFPGSNNFIKLLRKKHPEIETVIMNVNSKNTSMVLGNFEKVLYGRGFIEDEICGHKFRISSKSFYQVNSQQAEILYNKAIEMADFKGDERVIDAYCGVGTISLIVSKNVKEVIGVELNPDAVEDAIKNAGRNEIKNVYFHRDDAGEFLVKMAVKNEKIDAVILDPPRSGSDEVFLESLMRLKPNKIIYISCNPETQARDLEYILKEDYKVKEIQPVDMFPQTDHVECVIGMQRKDT